MKQTKNKTLKNKKGLSLMVEYVLIIVFSVVIALIVYGVLRTYIPQDKIACPEGTSLLIENYNYDCTPGNQILTFTIRNDGRFNVTGYFVYISDEKHESINAAGNNTDDPSPYMGDLSIDGIKLGMDPGISTSSTFKPGDFEIETYDFSDGISSPNQVYSLTIVPMRWQSENGKMKMVSCADEKITKTIECG